MFLDSPFLRTWKSTRDCDSALKNGCIFRYDGQVELSEALFCDHRRRWLIRYGQDAMDGFDGVCPLLNVDWDAGLTDTDFRNAELQGLNITYEDWTGSDFCGADLREATLEATNLDRVLYDETTQFPEHFRIEARSVYTLLEKRYFIMLLI